MKAAMANDVRDSVISNVLRMLYYGEKESSSHMCLSISDELKVVKSSIRPFQ